MIVNNKEVVQIEIPAHTDYASGYKAINEIMAATDEVEAAAMKIADLYGIQFSTGDYGNGRTYYPKGSNSDEYGLEYHCSCEGVPIVDGKLAEGIWMSSSEMC